jgi:hypothetical protein
MKKQTALMSIKKTSAILQAAVIASAALLPAMLLTSSASGAQLDNRFIDMSANQTSEGSGRDGLDAAGQDVTYRVGFDVPTAHSNLEGIVVEFCSNSPIIGDACTAPTGFNLNIAGPLAVTNVTGLTGTWAIDGASDANTLILTNATGTALSATDTVEFDLGTSAVSDGITNPTVNGTFYARIVTYDATANAAGYTSADPDAVGARIDDGGVALAVTNELTITARVQEILEFCVGTADADVSSTCTDISGTDVDLGVVDSSAVNDNTATPAYALIRTNAFYGASVFYKAEQDTTSGKLKIAGASCTDNTTELDRCFNSAIGSGTTAAPVSQAIAAGTEAFGMTLIGIDTTNGAAATTNLNRDAAYDGDGSTGGSCTAANAGVDEGCWAWADSGVFDTIASSSSVVAYEMAEIAFAATAAPTTPTGLYTVTANFVATSTF